MAYKRKVHKEISSVCSRSEKAKKMLWLIKERVKNRTENIIRVRYKFVYHLQKVPVDCFFCLKNITIEQKNWDREAKRMIKEKKKPFIKGLTKQNRSPWPILTKRKDDMRGLQNNHWQKKRTKKDD